MRELTEELKLEFQSSTEEELQDFFINACNEGDLDVVQYLLTSPELSHTNIHSTKNVCFTCASANGHLEIVRYLLTSSELKSHANIHTNNDEGFRMACLYGHLNVVQYLLTSPELKEHANIHVNDDCGFRFVIEKSYWHVLEYLLSLSGNQYIDFENTKYNLDWFIFKSHNNIIKAMIKSLYKNDMMVYLQNISKVEQYCKENSFNFDEWKKEITKDDEDININSHTTELFL